MCNETAPGVLQRPHIRLQISHCPHAMSCFIPSCRSGQTKGRPLRPLRWTCESHIDTLTNSRPLEPSHRAPERGVAHRPTPRGASASSLRDQWERGAARPLPSGSPDCAPSSRATRTSPTRARRTSPESVPPSRGLDERPLVVRLRGPHPIPQPLKLRPVALQSRNLLLREDSPRAPDDERRPRHVSGR